jgi:hypothetical protein
MQIKPLNMVILEKQGMMVGISYLFLQTNFCIEAVYTKRKKTKIENKNRGQTTIN